MYFRFVKGLTNFIQSRMETEEALQLARSVMRARIAERDANFLSFVEQGIFQNPNSPYLRLMQPKHIGYQDLHTRVGKDGIEATLSWLASEGVFFTVDEFKGKTPVVRNGVEFRCESEMFDNPLMSYVYEVRTGATRSAGVGVRISFDYLFQRSLYDAFLLNAHGCFPAPVANWFPLFPVAPGINSSLRFAHIGNRVERWFSQVAEDKSWLTWERRWGMKLLFAIHKLNGCELAQPEFVGLNEAKKVAEWAARAVQKSGRCVVYTFAASAVRVCAAAAEANLDIQGTRFLVTGEPLTPHKKREIEAVGAFAVPVYGVSEAGVIAAGCNHRDAESDSCHLYKDSSALITHRTAVPFLDQSIDSFLLTGVLRESPKVLLNVGMGDFGNISMEPCNCEYGLAGFDIKLSGIRSYEKLTGEGVTFVNTDFIETIEKELPERFGGQSTDYQLVETEDEHGLPRLRLLVSPRLGALDEKEIGNQFLEFLKHAESQNWAHVGTNMWKQTNTLQVEREYPIATISGKILPFHLLKTPHNHNAASSPREESENGISTEKVA
jgi:hypothetical protein